MTHSHSISALLRGFVLATVLAALASPAAAQMLVGPSIDWLSLRSGPTGVPPVGQGYGFGTGKLAGKTVNLESQFIYFPVLVESGDPTVAGGHALWISGGYTFGRTIRERVRVYGAIGFGELYRRFTLIPTKTDLDNPSIAFNAITVDGGVGVMSMFVRRFGIRGELRRGRAFDLSPTSNENDGGSLALRVTHVDYWRVKLGVVAVFGGPPPSRQSSR